MSEEYYFSKCLGCGIEVEVLTSYEPEMCCDGHDCGCYGLPLNPILCDVCERKAFGIPIKEETE